MEMEIRRWKAYRDVFDRIELELALKGPGWSNLQPTNFSLEVGFHRTSTHNQGRGGGENVRLLPARMIGDDHHNELHRNSVSTMRCAIDLPPGGIDRLERFRDGGPLYARIVGGFAYIPVGDNPNGEYQALRSLQGVGLNRSYSIYGKANRIDPEQWSDVLQVLRRERRLSIEVAIPAKATPESLLSELEDRQKAARRALENGSYAEVARIVFMMLEIMKNNPACVNERYSKSVCKHLNNMASGLRGVANLERHHHGTDGYDHVDRALAVHLLTSFTTLAAVWFPASPPPEE